jgi:mannose-6-phosphate isomerase-like protein (cupin superfamily)
MSRSLRNLFLAFLFGILFGSLRPVHRIFSVLPSIRRVNQFLIARTYSPVCDDQYKNFPIGKPQNLEEMGENYSPIPGTNSASPIQPHSIKTKLTATPAPSAGLSHLTLGGYQHTGNRQVEMWYETLAPEASTPIHMTSNELVYYFIDGEIHLTTRDRDGSLVTHEMLPNSTTTVLANARHQLANPGPVDATFILAFASPPMDPGLMFESWEQKRGKTMGPLPWDIKCPGPPPPPPPPIDLDEINRELRGEL